MTTKKPTRRPRHAYQKGAIIFEPMIRRFCAARPELKVFTTRGLASGVV